MKSKILLLCLISPWLWHAVQAQPITIDECYALARENYPAIRQFDLIAKTSRLDIQEANLHYLPQVTLSGQATYQSEVVDYTEIFGGSPLPSGITLPVLSRDQYRVLGEISQLIYDGGQIRQLKDRLRANRQVEESNLEITLYAINSRINTIYFSILLMDAQQQQIELSRSNLRHQLEKSEAALANGMAFRSNVSELKAELLQYEMQLTECKSHRTALLKILSLFTGRMLAEDIELIMPRIEARSASINRPELKWFDSRIALYDAQRHQLRPAYLPKITAFLQGAYGRPTLNMLKNESGPWLVTGLRFNWSLSQLYSLDNRKRSITLFQQAVDTERETFLLNTKMELVQQDEQVNKYEQLIKQDEDIIALRAAVTRSAEAQLENGVITVHEYIQKMNAEHGARLNKLLHEIQLRQAIYNQQFLSDN